MMSGFRIPKIMEPKEQKKKKRYSKKPQRENLFSKEVDRRKRRNQGLRKVKVKELGMKLLKKS